MFKYVSYVHICIRCIALKRSHTEALFDIEVENKKSYLSGTGMATYLFTRPVPTYTKPHERRKRVSAAQPPADR